MHRRVSIEGVGVVLSPLAEGPGSDAGEVGDVVGEHAGPAGAKSSLSGCAAADGRSVRTTPRFLESEADVRAAVRSRTRRLTKVQRAAERLPSGRSGEHAVDKNVDGEIKPLIAIASDHVRSMGSEMREPVGRQAGEGLIELVDLLAVAVTALPGRAPYIVLTRCAHNQQHEDVARPGGVLRVKPTGQKNAEQVFGQTQNRFGRG